MSLKTTNFNLVKPELTDVADITAMNPNWDAIDRELTGVKEYTDSHKVDKTNPHAVTKAQVGLGNVDNTSDMSKPVSTPMQNALNQKQDAVTGAASTVVKNNLTANRAVMSDGSGKLVVSPVTATELGYLDGVTSSVQTQLDNKQSAINGGASTITTTNLTTNRALISNGNGKVAVSPVTSTELGYLDGVKSNVQTQFDGKVSKAGDELTGELTFENTGAYHAIQKYREVNGKDYGVNVGCGMLGSEGIVSLECRQGHTTTSPLLGRLEIGSRGVSYVDLNNKRTYLVTSGLTAASIE